MKLEWGDRDVEVRPATRADADRVRAVLEAASAWLRSKGIQQWPEHFPLDWIGPSVDRGETWLAECGGHAAGTVTIASSDTAWPAASPDALYVHRLAVERWAEGLGGALLRWAGEYALANGCRFLRLDCVESNGRLRRYYEDARFDAAGDTDVHGTTVSRYERRLTA